MEHVSFLHEFPVAGEDRLYKKLAATVPQGYELYYGGNFICLKNQAGGAVRFTTPTLDTQNLSGQLVSEWLETLKRRYRRF